MLQSVQMTQCQRAAIVRVSSLLEQVATLRLLLRAIWKQDLTLGLHWQTLQKLLFDTFLPNRQSALVTCLLMRVLTVLKEHHH